MDDEMVRRSVIERFPGPKEFVARVTVDMRTEWLWGVIAGLMAGVVEAHAVQVAAALTGALEFQNKYWISAAGALLYAACLVLLLLRRRAGLWIAVCGPIAGVLGVSAAAVLVRLGVLPGPFRAFDAFQVGGGFLQVPALALAVALLRRPAPRS